VNLPGHDARGPKGHTDQEARLAWRDRPCGFPAAGSYRVQRLFIFNMLQKNRSGFFPFSLLFSLQQGKFRVSFRIPKSVAPI
jgi:hypothetical protein